MAAAAATPTPAPRARPIIGAVRLLPDIIHL
ncbi:hypothetical protein VTL71DRAFT_10403 [Oculimacula yallundae]|uniref:Uncharacterized protein n=1 Tax=Oculimacula yallundae TaxID=86028 RepID=A0ABR4CT58_9HELO